MREQIDAMTKEAGFGTAGEHQEILETYRMFAYDEGWSRRINEAIDSGLTAEAAIERVQQRMRARMRDIDDSLLQERMHDLEDLSNRLLRIVSGRMGTAAQTGLAHDTVLIARNLGPAELLEYDRRRLKGVLLEEGSLTSHMVIVARAIGVPVIGRLNAIGLSRAEFQSLVSETLRGRERQHRLYTKVLESAGNRPVVFRTVDIGGDKALPYLADVHDQAENPAMGWRALRLSLDRSTLMKAQARALIEASGGKVLPVMFPMISEP